MLTKSCKPCKDLDIWKYCCIFAAVIIGNYKIDMQPIRLTHKSLLPERPFGRTDALYIGLMRL